MILRKGTLVTLINIDEVVALAQAEICLSLDQAN